MVVLGWLTAAALLLSCVALAERPPEPGVLATPLQPREVTVTRLAETTPSADAQPTPNVQFTAQVTYSAHTLPWHSCDETAIAGEVTDDRIDVPLRGYTIEVTGPNGFRRTTYAGSEWGYGYSGWEVMLANDKGTPEPLQQGYTVRLFDWSGTEVATPILPDETMTGAGCDRALIYIVYHKLAQGQDGLRYLTDRAVPWMIGPLSTRA